MCGHCPESFGMSNAAFPNVVEYLHPKPPRPGLSREEFLLRHGPDEARSAILELRASAAPSKDGDPYGGLDKKGDWHGERGTPRESRSTQGSEAPQGESSCRCPEARTHWQAGEVGPDAGEAQGVIDQPPPQAGVTEVWPFARQNFERQFYGQRRKGFEKYGVHLTNFNGRDSYQDFLQEHVDSLMYATQLYQEARTFVDWTERAMRLVESFQTYLHGDPMTDVEVFTMVRGMDQFLDKAGECLEKSRLSQSQSPAQT